VMVATITFVTLIAAAVMIHPGLSLQLSALLVFGVLVGSLLMLWLTREL